MLGCTLEDQPIGGQGGEGLPGDHWMVASVVGGKSAGGGSAGAGSAGAGSAGGGLWLGCTGADIIQIVVRKRCYPARTGVTGGNLHVPRALESTTRQQTNVSRPSLWELGTSIHTFIHSTASEGITDRIAVKVQLIGTVHS